MEYSYWTLVFPIVTALCLIFFFLYYIKISLPKPGTTDWITEACTKQRFSLPKKRFPMERRDLIPMLAITIIYGIIAFIYLGTTETPESFLQFDNNKSTVVIALEEEAEIGNIMYYTGLCLGSYELYLSPDKADWSEQYSQNEEDKTAMPQKYSNLFKWQTAALNEDRGPVKYLRITALTTNMELGEVAIFDLDGNLLKIDPVESNLTALPLFDEQDIVPDRATCLNSMYFDEIYHGRTAFEHIRNIKPYETTHPPLGKLIIAIGIKIFGMNPIGWRFMGTLCGILMLILLYIFLKNMFGKTVIAACGTLLFAFDFMHYVQTRIATIDSYSVFFIILMYYFMYRYITEPYDAPLKKTFLPLFLCGLFFGIGSAAKWTSIYAGAGLLVLYIINIVLRMKSGSMSVRDLVKTLLFSVPTFIIIPIVIYCLSYIPYGLARGMTIKDGLLWNSEFYKIIWDNQVHMFTYHADLEATHPYGSPWWQWIFNIRPILYHLKYDVGENMRSSISAFGNPVVWWGGLLAIGAMVWDMIKYRSGKAFVIIVGYLAALLPWVIISRVVFVYHYFPCTIFLVFALAYVLNKIWERKRGRYKLAVYGFTASALVMFAAFYPLLSGVPALQKYSYHFLRWMPFSWPF